MFAVRLAPFIRSRPCPRLSAGAATGLTRAVLNRSCDGARGCGLGCELSAESAGGGSTAGGATAGDSTTGDSTAGDSTDGGATATGPRLSAAGDIAGADRASFRSLAGQRNCDLGGMSPVRRNQHLRPSISRQKYRAPALGSPGALMQSIAHADELPKQQHSNTTMTVQT